LWDEHFSPCAVFDPGARFLVHARESLSSFCFRQSFPFSL
jgi:hypothetical protein